MNYRTTKTPFRIVLIASLALGASSAFAGPIKCVVTSTYNISKSHLRPTFAVATKVEEVQFRRGGEIFEQTYPLPQASDYVITPADGIDADTAALLVDNAVANISSPRGGSSVYLKAPSRLNLSAWNEGKLASYKLRPQITSELAYTHGAIQGREIQGGRRNSDSVSSFLTYPVSERRVDIWMTSELKFDCASN